MGFPAGAGGKEPPCQCRRHVPHQYSYLENSMDKEAWCAKVHRVTKSQTRLSDFHFTSSQYLLMCISFELLSTIAIPHILYPVGLILYIVSTLY